MTNRKHNRTYSEIKSAERKESQEPPELPESPSEADLIQLAIGIVPPGSNLYIASHQEIMDYLNEILLPAIRAIARRVSDTQLPALTADERKEYSVVWRRISDVIKTNRPRQADAPVSIILRLLSITKQVSPAEVHIWLRRRY